MTEFPIDTSGDSRFSRALPGWQIKLNSSSLGPFKLCPRKYYYSVVCGLETEARSVHLTFGSLVHAASAKYDALRASGEAHEVALREVTRLLMLATWDKELSRGWVSGDGIKNRLSLLRTVVWYLDNYAGCDPAETVKLPSGGLAVELPFEFDSGFARSSTGERVEFIGTLDKIIKLNDYYFVRDIKTTGGGLGEYFFRYFTPGNQFSLYLAAARICFDFDCEGVIVDGIQVGAGFARFERAQAPRPKGVIEEWLEDSHEWIDAMQTCALREHWPQNDMSCGAFGGCEFRSICSASPKARATWLAKGWKKRTSVGQEDVL